MTLNQQNKVILTLDAGGTNFVFSAMQGGLEVVTPITLPSNGHHLEKCLETIVSGFKAVKDELDASIDAISFAFPGPADYPNGIIGDLANLPAFRGGVPLGPMLEEIFQVPVLINNDGDLFAYGEAMHGFLPNVNQHMAESGQAKRYKNLLGVTLGTGFGGGLVHQGKLFIGDNAAGAEVWAVQHPERPDVFAEEGISIRGVQRLYREFSGLDIVYTPKDISDIALGVMPGNREAALQTFDYFGKVLGSTLANVLTIVDAAVVIGGGISASYDLFIPSALKQLNGKMRSLDGAQTDRMEFKVFNFDDPEERRKNLIQTPVLLKVPGTDKEIRYDPFKRVPIGKSVLGTSRAVSIGAYAIALDYLTH